MRAKLCGEYNKEMFEAIKILHEMEFRVSSTPVSGIIDPELNYGSQIYYGLGEIKEFADYYKETNEILNIPRKYVF